MQVGIVGGAGFIGQAACIALIERGAQVRILDRAEGANGTAGVHVVDIARHDAEAALVDAFRGLKAVVHLAARVDPPNAREREAMRSLHLDGTRNVVRAAKRAGVEKLVLASSAVVYGARKENPVPLDESMPMRPNEDFPYAVDKAGQERIVESERGTLHVAIARPAIVYGRGARNYLTEILRRAPVLPALDGERPPLQFVHVDDVARGLAHLAVTDAQGVFNLAPRDWLSFDDVARIVRRRIVSVPHRAVAPVVDALVRVMPPHLRAPASMLPYLKYPFVLSSTRIADAGCAPRITSEDALREILR